MISFIESQFVDELDTIQRFDLMNVLSSNAVQQLLVKHKNHFAEAIRRLDAGHPEFAEHFRCLQQAYSSWEELSELAAGISNTINMDE